ncbi:MAG: hypothetical protein AB7G76_03285 [Steroidobacteraceae bacterium]
MTLVRKLLWVAAVVFSSHAALAADPEGPPPGKNWVAPAFKMHAQILVDQLMRDNRDLLSVTFHGTPPDKKGIYTMFAGTWPDRIGKISAADDVMVIESGFTLIDPRWNKQDPEPKFLVLVPLRDRNARNIGCIVFGFKNPPGARRSDEAFLQEANRMRDGLQSQIADHAALFARAHVTDARRSKLASWLILTVPERSGHSTGMVAADAARTGAFVATPWVRRVKRDAPSGFEQMSIFGFPDDRSLEAWRAAHAAQLGAPILSKRARALLGDGRGAKSSGKSIYKISYYSLTAPVSEFQDWVDGYLAKYLRAQQSSGILSSYMMYLEEGDKGRLLLVLEYPDAAIEASSEPVKGRLSDELAASDAVYAAQMEKKEKLRTTDSWTLAVPVETTRN